eukprot:3349954-Pleurochrysis_carterae.AAC.1
MHLSAAHLEELILRHGLLERGDDEILERDNRTAKRIKNDLLFWGGSSDPEKHVQALTHFEEVKDDAGELLGMELIQSERRRSAGQGEQFARLMLGRKLLLAERLKVRPADSAMKVGLVKHKREKTE